MKNMGKEFCLNLLQYHEDTDYFKHCYSAILNDYESEQAMVEARVEDDKKMLPLKGSKSKKESQNYASSSAEGQIANAKNNSSKKKNKSKTLKKSEPKNDKKRSHSAEPKQTKPVKKKNTAVSKNEKLIKPKKKLNLK